MYRTIRCYLWLTFFGVLSARVCYAPPVGIWINTSATSVANDVTAMDIEGGSYDMVGTMWWTNELNAADGSQPVGTSWTLSSVPLAVGDNRIMVTAEDSGGFPSYSEVTINRRSSPLTYYVSTNGGNVYPYTNWATAAAVIQDAVDAASAGDRVLVTNGVYDQGGTIHPGQDDISNRVTIAKAAEVRSVNGPEHTIIKGRYSGMSWWSHRCAYLTEGAMLSGFTLREGHTAQGDFTYERDGGGAFLVGGTLSNCIVTACYADDDGGGVVVRHAGTVVDCVISNNTATDDAGGIYIDATGSVLRCTIVNNRAQDAGGLSCYGPGSYSPISLSNCLIADNVATDLWGGVYWYQGGEIVNCTIAGNTAGSMGEDWTNEACGLDLYKAGPVRNCIVYDNTVDGATYNVYCDNDTLIDYICTYPDSNAFSYTYGNYGHCITNNPQFVGSGNYRLDYFSPCRDAGNNSYVSGDRDLQGQNRIQNGTVDLGAYEYPMGTDTGDSPLHYVWTNSPSPNWPYTNWATAGRVLQEVVDAADSGDRVLATNGVYEAGGGVTPGYALTNRVLIDRAITVMGVNGPSNTFIVGASDNGTNGPAAIRCAYLATNACVQGFTLTNGHTLNSGEWNLEMGGGGALLYHGGVVSNCVITDCSAGRHGGGVNMHHGGSVLDCVIRFNDSAVDGGGVLQEGTASRLADCDIRYNTASNAGGGLFVYTAGLTGNLNLYSNHATDAGGGAYFNSGGTLSNSTLSGNSTGDNGGEGGGMHGGTAADCTFANNFSDNGGGLYGGTAVHCTFLNNRAAGVFGSYGGGMYGGAATNCLFRGNYAISAGGGMESGDAVSCTLFGNGTGGYGGGMRYGTANNCIVWSNAGDNLYSVTAQYTCSPDVTDGANGCTTNDPQFVDPAGTDLRLQASSLCIDAGTNQSWMAGARDLDDLARIKGYTVDMGCYEHARVDTGPSPIHYASVTGNDVWPYTNWTDAARAIQDAVETADSGETVYVAEGVYGIGSAVTPGFFVRNRVMIDKPLTLLGVSGPSNTVIIGASDAGGFGSNAVRGIYIGTNAFVSGFTVSNGFTRGWQDELYYLDKSGGGIYMRAGAVVSNVIVRNCQAWFGGGGVYVSAATLTCSVVHNNYCDQYGGGAYGGYITQCEIRGNEVGLHGGGVYGYDETIDSCTIADNQAGSRGGGVAFDSSRSGRAVNCLIKANKAVQLADAVWIQSSTIEHCTIVSNRNGNEPIYGPHDGIIRNCVIVDNDGSVGDDYSRIEFTCTDDATVPSGTGNITNNPQFVDAVSGDYRLSLTSPCVDAGTNLAGIVSDLDGMWRPLDGNADGTNTADMGCYEVLNPIADTDGDTMPDGWEDYRDLDPIDPSDASGDPDDDACPNDHEYIADTDPGNSNSYFHLTAIDDSASCVVSFVCTNTRVYSLSFATNLLEGTWRPVAGATNVTGVGGWMSLTDSVDDVHRSYRVGVRLP